MVLAVKSGVLMGLGGLSRQGISVFICVRFHFQVACLDLFFLRL
jgi:hypothetical protein